MDLKGLKEILQCVKWDFGDLVCDTLQKVKNSYRARNAAYMTVTAGAILGGGITIAELAYKMFIQPQTAMAQEVEPQLVKTKYHPCALPPGKNPELTELRNKFRDKVNSMVPEFLLVKKKPGDKATETITDAVNGIAASYADDEQRREFINGETGLLIEIGYDMNNMYVNECVVPLCRDGCQPSQLLEAARAGPPAVLAEAAPPSTPENHNPTVSAGADLEGIVGRKIRITAGGADQDGDALKYKWEIVGQPDGSALNLDGAVTPTVLFTPRKAGQYTLRVTADDGRGGTAADDVTVNVKAAGLDLLKYGMNPAAMFNLGLGMYLGLKGGEIRPYAFHIEGGPLFGVAKRTDKDTLEIRNPMDGTLLGTIPFSKILETDVSGYYASVFAKIGDMTLLTFNVISKTQEGSFSIDAPGLLNPSEGQDASDYRRNDLSVQLGLRRGLYNLPGKFLVTGDLFLGYVGMNDESNDEYGSTSSSAEMLGGGAGLNAAFRIPVGDFQVVPGLGAAYHYYSGQDDDMHSLLVTKGGVYDIRWGEFFGMSLDYTYRAERRIISDKELEINEDTQRVGLEMIFGKRRLLGAGFGYTIAGTYEEELPGDLLSREGNVTGFDAQLIGRYPVSWGNIGARAGYKVKKVGFNASRGDLEESTGDLGVFVEF